MLAIAALWAAQWLQLSESERDLRAKIAQETESFAATFEQNTRRIIKEADRTALLAKHENDSHGAHDLSHLISTGLMDGGEVAQVSVIDAQGNLLVSNISKGPLNVSDREFFQHHAAEDTTLLDIGKPIRQRLVGKTMIPLSRRLNNRDGSFGGVLVMSVAPEQFTAIYDETDLHAKGILGLFALDGTVLARRAGNEPTTIDGERTGASIAARAASNPTGMFEMTSSVDGVTRVIAYRKLPDYALIVIAGQSRDEAYAEFTTYRTTRLILAAVATFVISVFFSIITILALRLQHHRHELKRQRHFLRTILANLPSGIVVRDMRPGATGRCVIWNEASEVMFGRKAEDALGKTISDILSPEGTARVLDLDRTMLSSPMVQESVETGFVGTRGRRILHFVRAPIFDSDGEVEYIISSVTDITEDRARTDELRLASKVFETTADGIMLTDRDDRIIMVNAAFTKLTGYEADEVLGQVLADSAFRPIDIVESEARMDQLHAQGYVTSEVSRFRKDGTPLSLWVTATCVRDADGAISNYVRVFTDISLLKATQEKLEKLASLDTLTGLPNRRLLEDRLAHALRRAERSGTAMALMFIDLDRFKKVNDTLGHDIGDRLLCEVALRLQSCVRGGDTISRVGGDEFAVVLESANDAAAIGRRIVAALAVPFELDGHKVHTTASIGIALYPTNGTDAMTLFRNADQAMYTAKQSGKNRFQYFVGKRGELAPAA